MGGGGEGEGEGEKAGGEGEGRETGRSTFLTCKHLAVLYCSLYLHTMSFVLQRPSAEDVSVCTYVRTCDMLILHMQGVLLMLPVQMYIRTCYYVYSISVNELWCGLCNM